jgi:hypothetical protein
VELRNCRESLYGLYSVMADSLGSYFPVDCGKVTADDLNELTSLIQMESVTTYVYLDEVAELSRRGLDRLLLKSLGTKPLLLDF